jgi:hypothetical protein
MRKLFALAAIAMVALTFATGCAPKKEEPAPATEQAPAPTMEQAAPADTTAGGAATDTTSHM